MKVDTTFGKFVVIEGDDYAGKTTFINYLRERHPEYVYSREPGGCPTSEKIRDLLLSDAGKEIDPLTRFHLFWASRAENVAKVIRPALLEGKIVVTDRFDASTYAFQIGGDQSHDLERYFWQTRELHLRYLDPIYIFFHVPARVAKERKVAKMREANHFDHRNEAYHADVARYYWRFFANGNIRRRELFDADLPEEEMVAKAYLLFEKLVS